MTRADLSAVLQLWHQTEGVGLSPEETETMLAGYLERNPGLSLVATAVDGSVVAAVLCGHDGRRGYLYHLAVASAHRRRGLGRALVQAGLAALKACGVAKASLVVYTDNAEGRAFWERLGWRAREDLCLMQQSL